MHFEELIKTIKERREVLQVTQELCRIIWRWLKNPKTV
ncbi:hypothetical protein FLSI110296_06255 [Flavobacterium sinopsychrotolerans]